MVNGGLGFPLTIYHFLFTGSFLDKPDAASQYYPLI
jgi:hypothetical protein